VLEINGLTAGYGQVPIVRNFSTGIEKGTVTTLIGGNGAGKSTLMRAIYGTCQIFEGSISFNGLPVERLASWDRLQLGIGLVPQGRCNFSDMTVAENLKMACYTLPKNQVSNANEEMLSLFPFLNHKLKVFAGNLSGGEQQMLEMAMVMCLKPSLLLLDEPSLGLSPKMQEEIFDMAKRLTKTGVTVLMVEQNAYGALKSSDNAIVMELGQKYAEGPALDILNDPLIGHAFLGVE